MKHVASGTISIGLLTACLIAAPSLDGVHDAEYGEPSTIQNTETSFGNNDNPDLGVANGSELNIGDALIEGNVLYIMLAGNLESNGNKLEIFIDARDGGQNRLRGDNPDVDYNGLNRMGNDWEDNGLTFDAGFEADMYVTVNCTSTESGKFFLHASSAEIRTDGGGAGAYLGVGGAGEANSIVGPNGIEVVLDNSSIGGVEGGTGIGCGEGVTTGIEIGIPLYNFDWDIEGLEITSASICAFINDDVHGHVSNQVLGGIASGDNLGEPRILNFNGIAGNQYFITGGTAEPCPEPIGACCSDGGCQVLLDTACAKGGGEFQGYGTDCAVGNPCDLPQCESDINDDGSVDVGDLLQVIGDWGCMD
jgi:hypothetical protein